MPKVLLTAAQREADRAAYRQKEFVRIFLNFKVDGISHQSLAADIGVSPATVSDWKRDSGKMSLRAFRKFVDVAHLTDDEILRIVRGKKN